MHGRLLCLQEVCHLNIFFIEISQMVLLINIIVLKPLLFRTTYGSSHTFRSRHTCIKILYVLSYILLLISLWSFNTLLVKYY